MAYMRFQLSADDLDWTRHWLNSRQRCDHVHILIADDNVTDPLIKIVALESKSSSEDEPLEPLPWVDPFKEACGQVGETLAALQTVISPIGADTLVEDLKFSSFVEHLASIVLAQLHPIRVDDQRAKAVLTNLNGFSLRTIPPTSIRLEGVVVCTQYNISVPSKATKHQVTVGTHVWPVTLVRAGALEIEELLRGHALAVRLPSSGEPAVRKVPPAETSPEPGRPSPLQTLPSNEPEDVSANNNLEPLSASQVDGSSQVSPDIDANVLQQCEAIRSACQRRDLSVGAIDQRNIRIGPSVVVLSLPLKPGASLKPIEGVVEDLEREAGVASLMVENDPALAYHIRFSFARSEREYPPLPIESAPVVDKKSNAFLGLYIGRDVDGTDVISYMSSWPHMLIAGTSGSGKTTFMRAMLLQLNRVPHGLIKFVVIDGKGETDYLNLLDRGHLAEEFPEILLGFDRVNEVLDWVVEEEIPRRRGVLRELAMVAKDHQRISAAQEFVACVSQNRAPPFPALTVVVDEFNELMLSGGAGAQRFEQRIQQITQTGRSTLVHLILATQRPDIRVIRGSIKANLDSRIAMRLPTVADSMTILGRKGAESLLGRGDMIFQPGGSVPIRLQGYTA